MTTYTAFVSAISGLSVTGVTRRFAGPPASVSTADLPASYPMLPSGQENLLVMGNASAVGSNQSTLTCDMVYIVEPTGQGTQAQDYAAVLTLIDNIVTASEALTRPTRGPMTFTLKTGIVILAGNEYWGIIQSWTGIG